jgi:molybdate transport system substrate-binding protein
MLVWVFAAAPSGARAETFTVFAAASLSDALNDVIKTYQARTQDTVRASYAASSALARQIENGAPADVFISADLEWMDYLQKKSLVQPASRFDLVRNALVLIAPAGSTITLAITREFPLSTALGNGRLAVADPGSVPAGRYAKSALETLGVWPSIANRVASAGDVRAALLLVARGEAPLGIVYSTDATVERRVKIVDTFPERTHPPIVYPAALTAASKSAAAARFLQVMREPAARGVFERYGFKPASPP